VTVQSLYVTSRPGPIELTSLTVGFALVLALSVAVLSALAPALEAAQVAPTGAMARGSREHAVRVHATRQMAVAGAFGLAAWVASQQGPCWR
jgi:hypothetical protein